MHAIASKTASLDPKHQYVPWVVLNGKHTEEINNRAARDLLGLICESYEGEKPEPCGREEEEEDEGSASESEEDSA